MIPITIFCVLFMLNVCFGLVAVHEGKTGWINWLAAGLCLAAILYKFL